MNEFYFYDENENEKYIFSLNKEISRIQRDLGYCRLLEVSSGITEVDIPTKENCVTTCVLDETPRSIVAGAAKIYKWKELDKIQFDLSEKKKFNLVSIKNGIELFDSERIKKILSICRRDVTFMFILPTIETEDTVRNGKNYRGNNLISVEFKHEEFLIRKRILHEKIKFLNVKLQDTTTKGIVNKFYSLLKESKNEIINSGGHGRIMTIRGSQ